MCQWLDRKPALINYATNEKKTTWEDVDTQIEFLIAELSGQGPAAQYATIRKKGYIADERITSTNEQWRNSKTVEEATLHFMRFYESPGHKEARICWIYFKSQKST